MESTSASTWAPESSVGTSALVCGGCEANEAATRIAPSAPTAHSTYRLRRLRSFIPNQISRTGFRRRDDRRITLLSCELQDRHGLSRTGDADVYCQQPNVEG